VGILAATRRGDHREAAGQHALEACGRVAGGRLQDDAAGQQADRRGQLGRPRRATLVAQLMEPLWRRGFCTLAAHLRIAIDRPIMLPKRACSLGSIKGRVSAMAASDRPIFSCMPIWKMPNWGATLDNTPSAI